MSNIGKIMKIAVDTFVFDRPFDRGTLAAIPKMSKEDAAKLQRAYSKAWKKIEKKAYAV